MVAGDGHGQVRAELSSACGCVSERRKEGGSEVELGELIRLTMIVL